MKIAASLLGLAVLAQSVSAHYIFNGLIHGDNKVSTAAVRQPSSNSPVHDVTSNDIRCNIPPFPATEIVTVAPGETVGFTVVIQPGDTEPGHIYHKGPAAIYLGKAPGSAASWDGSGVNWFKIAEWGVVFDPFTFTAEGLSNLTVKLPDNTPPGEYLLRAEQIGLHNLPAEFFVGCAQIKITGSGTCDAPKVAIPSPEYMTADDPGLNVNIWGPPWPTNYTVPGPAVWDGSKCSSYNSYRLPQFNDGKMICFELGSYLVV